MLYRFLRRDTVYSALLPNAYRILVLNEEDADLIREYQVFSTHLFLFLMAMVARQ
jgi:hypothetical protein